MAVVVQVLAAARKFAEGASGVAAGLEFVQLQDGYRMFDAMRGMDYMVDLLYRNQFGEPVVHRVHLTRSIASTQLMHQVYAVIAHRMFNSFVHLWPIKLCFKSMQRVYFFHNHQRLGCHYSSVYFLSKSWHFYLELPYSIDHH